MAETVIDGLEIDDGRSMYLIKVMSAITGIDEHSVIEMIKRLL